MSDHGWLVAEYHFPSLYSIRSPLSSMSSAPTLPAPSPSTVRLALVKTGIELFGLHAMREQLFPIIRSMPVAIRPPQKIAITAQRLRAYKAATTKETHQDRYVESLVYREYAHATGTMSIYIDIPTAYEAMCRALLWAIGYWGQAHSFTQCVAVTEHAPTFSECLTPLRMLDGAQQIGQFAISLASEFRSPELTWNDILPIVTEQKDVPLTIELYVWPMTLLEQHRDNRILLRSSIW